MPSSVLHVSNICSNSVKVNSRNEFRANLWTKQARPQAQKQRMSPTGIRDDGPLPEPPVDLPDDQSRTTPTPVDESCEWERSHNVLAGERALRIVQLVRAHARSGRSPPANRSRSRSAPRSRSVTAPRRLVDVTVLLRDRLPATLRAVSTGDLSWHKATILAEATALLTAEQARHVEDLTLPKAAGRTPAQHADAVRRAVARVDPDGADARRRQAAGT